MSSSILTRKLQKYCFSHGYNIEVKSEMIINVNYRIPFTDVIALCPQTSLALESLKKQYADFPFTAISHADFSSYNCESIIKQCVDAYNNKPKFQI